MYFKDAGSLFHVERVLCAPETPSELPKSDEKIKLAKRISQDLPRMQRDT